MTQVHRMRGWLLVIVVAVSVCVARAESTGCAGLKGITLPASRIGLPTTGAEVSSAKEKHAGGVAYCRVMGKIYPVDPNAEDIRFELNLPETWNGKALQYGGGTFDGYLGSSNGLKRTEMGLKRAPTPLMQGYATFGSDGGHHKNYFPLPDVINTLSAEFARNAEMQKNFAGDALKKLHDVAVVLMKARYGVAPRRMYFIGGSTGGREALRAAQRYPEDYDGVLAAYAAWDQAELDLQFVRTAQALYAPGGFLGFTKTRMIARRVEERCDAKDGLRDGIISDPARCNLRAAELRCKDGRRHHGCLSDAQVHTLETFATEERTAMPLSNGVQSIPGYNVLAGASLSSSVGLLHFPLKNPVVVLNSFGYVIGDDVTRNFLSVGHHFNSRTFDINSGGPWHDELLKAAREIDSTSVALEPFVARGGKMILVHGTSDPVIPTNSTVDYFERLQARMGIAETKSFARMYLVPGMGHGDGRFDGGFDTVGVLDAWVDGGMVPENLVVTDNNNGRTRPMCEWPAWPKYDGVGDVKRAGSFTCVSPVVASGMLQAAVQ